MEEEPGTVARRGDQEGDGRNYRADRRDHPGAALGIRADRLHPRHFRRAVPAVRGDDQRRDADLGAERADPVAGVVRRIPAPWRPAARADGLGAAADRRRAQRLCRDRAAPGAGVGPRRRRDPGERGRRSISAGLRTPTGFLPEEDQGAFFVSVQLPDGASVSRTSEAAGRIEELLRQMPQVQNVFAIIGYSILDGVSEPNSAFLVADAEAVRGPPRRGQLGAGADCPGLRRGPAGPHARPSSRSTCRRSSDCRPPAGSNTSSKGSKGRTPRRWAASCRGWSRPPTRTRACRVCSRPTPRPTRRSISISTARRRRRSASRMSDVFNALQSTLGGFYVNNFNLFGRVWQVNIQGEAADRTDISSIWQIYIRNKFGNTVPMRAIANARIDARAAGHHPLQQLSGDPDTGRPVPRHLLRHGAGRDGRCLGQDAAGRLRLRMDRHRLPGGRRLGTDRRDPRRWRCCSRSCSWSASTRAG